MLSGDLCRVLIGFLKRYIPGPIGEERARGRVRDVAREGEKLAFPIGLYLHWLSLVGLIAEFYRK